MDVYVFGCGGHGRVVASVLEAGGASLKGFLDENPGMVGKKIFSIPVLGGFEHLEKLLKEYPDKRSSIGFVVGIGHNQSRERVFKILKEEGVSPVSAIHPSSIIHSSVVIGEGTVAMAGVIVNADTRVGGNVILNTGASLDHDCLIGDHAHLAPGVVLAGGVTVEEGAFLGVGVCVVPGVRIGARAIVGAGAVVLEDVPNGKTVAGVPARLIS